MPSLSFTDPIEVVLLNSIEWIDFTFLDDNGNPIEAQSVSLTIYDSSQAVYLTQTYPVILPTTTRIQHPTLGFYYFPFGQITPPPGTTNVENGATGVFYFNWSVQPFATTTPTAEPINVVQTVIVITPKTSALLQQFRQQVDKSGKMIIQDPVNPLYLGYTEAQLLSYLAGGLSQINEMQPGVTWDRIDNFPDIHGQLLIDSAMIVAIRSQELFAIDTDIPNYSDSSNVFVIQHQPQLSAFLAALWQHFEIRVHQMKLQYVMTGSLYLQAGPSFRLATLMNAAPSGALFRNLFAVI